jgi:chaperonin GroES
MAAEYLTRPPFLALHHDLSVSHLDHRPFTAYSLHSAVILALSHIECQTRHNFNPHNGGRHKMKLKPLGDRLIVQAIEEEETTASGLVLPDTAKEKPQRGKVVAVGDGSWDEDGEKRIPLDVAEGDEVLYSKYGGTELKVDGDDVLVLRESDVLAKVV